MFCEEYRLDQFAHGLEEGDSPVRLRCYARGRTGLLADDGNRWAVLILPGGAYRRIAPAESEPVALAFVAAGVQAFVLDYSVLPARWPRQFLEAASAMAFLRKRAERFGFSPDALAVCGFSAGGHLAGCLANLWRHPVIEARLGLSPHQVRPDAAILGYPVIHHGETVRAVAGEEPDGALYLERSVTGRNPPTFLWATGADASVPAENTLDYAAALRRAGVPLELHLFSDGPHAMGLADRESARDEAHCNPHAANWFPLCAQWLKGL